MTLAPNTVPWAANDPVEEPHYYQEICGRRYRVHLADYTATLNSGAPGNSIFDECWAGHVWLYDSKRRTGDELPG